MTEEEEFEFRRRLEAEQGSAGGRQIVEPNSLQRAMGIRRNRYKDENLAGNIGRGMLTFGEDMGREATLAASEYGLPPSAANAIGFAADAGTYFLPVGSGAKAGQAVGKPVLEKAGKFVMQSAVKPNSRAIANGDAAKAIDTMLEEGISATPGGAAKLRQKITELKGEVTKIINDQPGTLVQKAPVYKELSSLLDELAPLGQRGEAQQEAVRKAWEQFKNHPLARGETAPIPLPQADKIKRAFQKEAEGAYGSVTRPAIEDRIDMATAAGMRKASEAAAPEIGPYNAKLSQYIKALEQLEPRAAQAANAQIGGFVPLAQTPEAAMAMLADRNPWMKSLIARVLYSGRGVVPTAAGGTAGALVPAANERGQ